MADILSFLDGPAQSEQSSSKPLAFLDGPPSEEPSPAENARRDLEAGLRVGRSREDTVKQLATAGVKLSEKALQEYDLQIAKQKARQEWDAQNAIVQTGRKYARSFLPFGELVNKDIMGVQVGERTGDYMEAKKRFDEGKASKQDLARIAAHDQAEAVDQNAQRSFAGKIGSSLGGISQMTGELAAMGGAGKALGLAAPETLLGSKTLGFAGTQLAATAAAPSMWLEEGRQRNMREGRDEYDLKGGGQAFLMGYANMLVLGRLTGRVAGKEGFQSLAGKGLAAPAIGTVEQGLLDTAAAFADSILGTTLKPEGGWINDLANGKFGKAGEEAAVNFLTFAVAGGLHELADRGSTTVAEREARSRLALTRLAVDAEAKKAPGGTAPDAAMAFGVRTIATWEQTIAQAQMDANAAGKTWTRADQDALIKDVPKGPLRDYLDAKTKIIPVEGIPPKAPERTPVPTAPVVAETPTAPETPAPAEKSPESPPVAEPVKPTETPPGGPIAPPATPGSEKRPVYTLSAPLPSPEKTLRGESLVRHDVMDATGKVIAYADLRQDGLTLNINWTGRPGAAAGEQKNTLGMRAVNDGLRQLAAMYPDAILARGRRAEGPRKGQMWEAHLDDYRPSIGPAQEALKPAHADLRMAADSLSDALDLEKLPDDASREQLIAHIQEHGVAIADAVVKHQQELNHAISEAARSGEHPAVVKKVVTDGFAAGVHLAQAEEGRNRRGDGRPATTPLGTAEVHQGLEANRAAAPEGQAGGEVQKVPGRPRIGSAGSGLDKLPPHLRDEINNRYEVARIAGIVDKVLRLSAEGKTAKEAGEEIKGLLRGVKGHDPDIAPSGYVYAVRAKHSVPSMDDKTAFAKWQTSFKAGERTVAVPPQGTSNLFAPPAGGAAPAGKSAEPAPSPGEILATARKLYSVPDYPGTPPGGKKSDIAYNPEAGATMTGKMAATDVARGLHDIAHHLEATGKLETNPTALPPDVRAGLAEFDYDPKRPVSPLKMKEGFAEWFRRRMIGDLDGLTDNQKAAAAFAERFLKSRKFTEKADRIAEMFDKFLSTDPAARGRLITSGTAKPAEADLTRGERVKDATQVVKERFQDEIENNLGPIVRLEADINATRIRRGITPLRPDELASPVYAMFMFREAAIAGEFARDGVWTISGGHKVRIGQSDAEIHGDVNPDWLKPGKDGEASRLGAYAIARSAVGDWTRGERTISAEQHETYKALLEHERADPEFGDKAEAWSERMTRGFLDHVWALETLGRVEPGTTEKLHAKRPDYVPHYRVGKLPGTILHKRTGSGEAIVDPVISLGQRRATTAFLVADQLKRLAVDRLLSEPGMGEYALAAPVMATEIGKEQLSKIVAEFEKMGITGLDPMTVLKDMGITRPELFASVPWPKAGEKPTWGLMKDGKFKNWQIGNEALYDLITNQQVDSHQTATLLSNMAKWGINTPIGRVEPIGAATQVVRGGATALSLGFQVRNIPRDAYEFIKNTVDRTTVASLPQAYGSAFKFLFQTLTGRMTGKKPTNAMFQRFYDERGHELRQFGFQRNEPTSAFGKEPTTVGSLWGIFKDVLNLAGAGELAPRFLEWKTRLEQTTGKKIDQLKAEMEAADKLAQAGHPYVDPIPFWAGVDALNHAAEVTVPFGRQGIVTREVNKITPFFGPAVAGMSKAVRNWRDNTKGAMIGLAGVMALRAMHWAMFSDEEWWQEINSHDRFNNFVVDYNGTRFRFPGPRDLEVPAGGMVTTLLDALSDKHPDFKGLLKETWEAVAPPRPLPVPVKIATDIATNKNWIGSPIVPKSKEDLSAWEKAKQFQGPYALEQATGGRGSLTGIVKGQTPFSEVHDAKRSVTEFYDALHELKSDSIVAKGEGKAFPDKGKLHRMESAAERIQHLSAVLKKETDATPERKAAINRMQIQIAKAAMGQ